MDRPRFPLCVRSAHKRFCKSLFSNKWGKMIATGTLVLETGVLPVVFSLGGEECRAENRHESSEGAFLAYVVKEIFLLRIAFPHCLMAGDAVHTVLEQQRRGVSDSGIVMAAAKQSCSESLLLSYPNGGPWRLARKRERWKPFLPRGDSNQTVQVLIVKKSWKELLTGANFSWWVVTVKLWISWVPSSYKFLRSRQKCLGRGCRAAMSPRRVQGSNVLPVFYIHLAVLFPSSVHWRFHNNLCFKNVYLGKNIWGTVSIHASSQALSASLALPWQETRESEQGSVRTPWNLHEEAQWWEVLQRKHCRESRGSPSFPAALARSGFRAGSWRQVLLFFKGEREVQVFLYFKGEPEVQVLLYFKGEREVPVLLYFKGEPEVQVLLYFKGEREVQVLLYFKGEREVQVLLDFKGEREAQVLLYFKGEREVQVLLYRGTGGRGAPLF